MLRHCHTHIQVFKDARLVEALLCHHSATSCVVSTMRLCFSCDQFKTDDSQPIRFSNSYMHVSIFSAASWFVHATYLYLDTLPLIGQSFPMKQEFFCKKPFRKPAKSSENYKRDFPLFSFQAIMTLGRVYVFCPLRRKEYPN